MQDDQDQGNNNREMYEHYRVVADKGQKPLRIDKFLVNKLDVSRNKIQNAAEAGNILVNDKPVKSNYKIKPGDVVSIVMAYPPREIELMPEDIPLEIVYEDDDLVVVNKKAGMVVHPGYGHYSGTLINALLYHLKDLPGFKDGEIRPGLVHRIDKNTSGLLLVAKNDMAMNKLARQFYEKTIHREYVALVWGSLRKKEGKITGHIGRNLKNRKVMQVFPAEDRGKKAVTHYQVMEDFYYVSLVRCWLETGRTHQIRIHFKYIRHSLFNDGEYGGDKILKGTLTSKYKQFINNCFQILPRQALHAKTLGFKHPSTGKYMHFDSDIPGDMQQVIARWRNYTANRYPED
ncbi:MAG: RluA family pseudouridine synthase [Bacteroidales bacterium]|nr:RluA family pseudouridine synthase [Bacteroidales bacterium]